MAGAASLTLLMIVAGEGRAETVSVQGANGADFIYPDEPATDGESVTATAGSMQPVTDPYNSAYATGGNGGQGVSDLIGQSGGNGGSASATAATTVISGSAEADATAVGGAFVGGGYGIAREAYAVADAAAAGGGNAVAKAFAMGGLCLGACQSSNNGYATSNAETVNGAMADAQSVASPGMRAEGQASSSAKTSFAAVSVQSSALATLYGPLQATTHANVQGGSGQAFVNPGQTAYAFSTALPDKAYATTLIGGAGAVASAFLGPGETIFGTAILGADFTSQSSDASSTFDFHYQGDLLLGLIDGGGNFTVTINGVQIVEDGFISDTVINLGSDFGPNIDLTIVTYGSGGFVLGGAVPEPSTWAMMLVGFAGFGFMSSRRVHHDRIRLRS
ncbi:MAG: PEP-CTERM sorting domain-containing protein [Roseiarcus sp.]